MKKYIILGLLIASSNLIYSSEQSSGKSNAELLQTISGRPRPFNFIRKINPVALMMQQLKKENINMGIANRHMSQACDLLSEEIVSITAEKDSIAQELAAAKKALKNKSENEH